MYSTTPMEEILKVIEIENEDAIQASLLKFNVKVCTCRLNIFLSSYFVSSAIIVVPYSGKFL